MLVTASGLPVLLEQPTPWCCFTCLSHLSALAACCFLAIGTDMTDVSHPVVLPFCELQVFSLQAATHMFSAYLYPSVLRHTATLAGVISLCLLLHTVMLARLAKIQSNVLLL